MQNPRFSEILFVSVDSPALIKYKIPVRIVIWIYTRVQMPFTSRALSFSRFPPFSSLRLFRSLSILQRHTHGIHPISKKKKKLQTLRTITVVRCKYVRIPICTLFDCFPRYGVISYFTEIFRLKVLII